MKRNILGIQKAYAIEKREALCYTSFVVQALFWRRKELING